MRIDDPRAETARRHVAAARPYGQVPVAVVEALLELIAEAERPRPMPTDDAFEDAYHGLAEMDMR